MKTPVKVVVTAIPSVGTCTLVPYERDMPFVTHSYKEVAHFIDTLDLAELPELRHHQFQEIFKTIALILSGSNLRAGVDFGIVLSGSHDSYTSINTDIKEQKKRRCVTLMDFCTCSKQDGGLSDCPFPNHFEMMLDELPIEESLHSNGKNIIFILFLGTYTPSY